MTMEEVIGDAAYSEKGNLEYVQRNNIKLISKLNPSVSQGVRKQTDEFEFNKDAGLYVCTAGHMAIRKSRTVKKIQIRIKSQHTISISKYASGVLFAMDITKKVHNLNPIVFRLNQTFI